jgi:hypothetical protein
VNVPGFNHTSGPADFEIEAGLLRKQIPDFLRPWGFVITKRNLDKLCWLGQGPEPKFSFGGRFVYSPAEVIRWAKSRCKPVNKAA